jgi:hypothetical protein
MTPHALNAAYFTLFRDWCDKLLNLNLAKTGDLAPSQFRETLGLRLAEQSGEPTPPIMRNLK